LNRGCQRDKGQNLLIAKKIEFHKHGNLTNLRIKNKYNETSIPKSKVIGRWRKVVIFLEFPLAVLMKKKMKIGKICFRFL